MMPVARDAVVTIRSIIQGKMLLKKTIGLL